MMAASATPDEVAVDIAGLGYVLYGILVGKHKGKATVRVFNGRDPGANSERIIVVDEDCIRPWRMRR